MTTRQSIIAGLIMLSSFAASADECGQVKWFDPIKGVGFISPAGRMHGQDIFVTWQEVMSREGGSSKPLQVNEKVVYDRVTGPDGTLAQKVRVVNQFPQDVCR